MLQQAEVIDSRELGQQAMAELQRLGCEVLRRLMSRSSQTPSRAVFEG